MPEDRTDILDLLRRRILGSVEFLGGVAIRAATLLDPPRGCLFLVRYDLRAPTLLLAGQRDQRIEVSGG